MFDYRSATLEVRAVLDYDPDEETITVTVGNQGFPGEVHLSKGRYQAPLDKTDEYILANGIAVEATACVDADGAPVVTALHASLMLDSRRGFVGGAYTVRAMGRFTRHLPIWARRPARAAKRNLWQSYPAFFLRSLPRALRPRTLNDKIIRRMLFDRRPFIATRTDKVSARTYVRETLGERYLTEAYAIVDDARAIDWRALPRTYVCKVAHGCGGVIVVTDQADPTVVLPDAKDARWRRFFIHPDQADPAAISAICEQWLGIRFGCGPGSNHEWQYRDLTPRVLFEELLTQPDGAPASDYKFDVFHGRCRVGHLMSGHTMGERLKRKHRFWPNGSLIVDETLPTGPDDAPELPADFDAMVRVAETLSAGVDYVRVDLYNTGDRIVFGELTFTPSRGRTSWPPNVARTLAGYW